MTCMNSLTRKKPLMPLKLKTCKPTSALHKAGLIWKRIGRKMGCGRLPPGNFLGLRPFCLEGKLILWPGHERQTSYHDSSFCRRMPIVQR